MYENAQLLDLHLIIKRVENCKMKSLKQAVIFLLCLLHDDYAITLNLLCLVIMIIIYGETWRKNATCGGDFNFLNVCFQSTDMSSRLCYYRRERFYSFSITQTPFTIFLSRHRFMLLLLSHLLKIVLKAIISV